jgi:hypothetical protein
MAYAETNDIINEALITPEEQAERNQGLLNRQRLREAGELKRAAERIRRKPVR